MTQRMTTTGVVIARSSAARAREVAPPGRSSGNDPAPSPTPAANSPPTPDARTGAASGTSDIAQWIYQGGLT